MTISHSGISALSKGCYKVAWCGLGTESGAACCASNGSAVIIPAGFNSVTIQVLGTFAGATIAIEGSNDGGTTYAQLNDTRGEGNALTFTSADLRQLAEIPQQIRPALTAGCASDLDVIVILRATGR